MTNARSPIDRRAAKWNVLSASEQRENVGLAKLRAETFVQRLASDLPSRIQNNDATPSELGAIKKVTNKKGYKITSNDKNFDIFLARFVHYKPPEVMKSQLRMNDSVDSCKNQRR